MVGMRTCTVTTLPPCSLKLALSRDLPGSRAVRPDGLSRPSLAGRYIALGECFEGRLYRDWHVHRLDDRVEGLQPVARVDDHRLGLRFELALLEELAQHADGDAAGRLAEDALAPGEQPDRVDDLVVAHVGDRPAGAAHHVEYVWPVGRVADGQRLGDGGRADRADHVLP